VSVSRGANINCSLCVSTLIGSRGRVMNVLKRIRYYIANTSAGASAREDLLEEFG
jgi:hypothetical protein